MSHLKRNETVDLIWTLGSFGIMAIAGFGINITIGVFFSPEILGAFNQVFAIFIILSQLSTFGIHYSVGKFIPQHYKDEETTNDIVSSALVLVAIISMVVAGLSSQFSVYFGQIFDSSLVESMWRNTWVGLILFSINKVGLSILNGKSFMKMFSIVQSTRYLAMILFVFLIGYFRLAPAYFGYVFLFSELLVLLILGPSILKNISLKVTKNVKRWQHQHFRFGANSMLSGAVIELNSRVDVLILGYFSSDSAVGIYSVALLISEGLMQFSTAIRANINPTLTKYFHHEDMSKFQQFAFSKIKFSYLAFIPIGILSALLYQPVVTLVFDSTYLESTVPFYILLGSVFVSFGFLPLSMLLLQIGRPLQNTLVQIVVSIINIAGNAILIPVLGIKGAALGTGLSIVANACFIFWNLKRIKKEKT